MSILCLSCSHNICAQAEKRNTLGRGIVLALPSKSRPCGVVLWSVRAPLLLLLSLPVISLHPNGKTSPVDPHSLVLAAVQGLIHAARSAGMAGRLAVLCQFSWPTFQSELLGAVETLIHADDPELWVHKISGVCMCVCVCVCDTLLLSSFVVLFCSLPIFLMLLYPVISCCRLSLSFHVVSCFSFWRYWWCWHQF